jgi:hypothetical protein
MSKYFHFTFKMLLSISLVAFSNYAWAAPTDVGNVHAMTGIVGLVSAEGKRRIVAVGSKLFEGDIVTTQANSTAVLTFTDTSQVALRADSKLSVKQFSYKPESPSEDKAQFKLVKGGLRTLTGLIGKRGNPDAFSLKAEAATIGIRGTDFSVRLCKGDCLDVLPTNMTKLNTPQSGAANEGQVYLAVNDGKVLFTNAQQSISVSKGEGATLQLSIANLPTPPMLLPSAPPILTKDVVLTNANFAPPVCVP